MNTRRCSTCGGSLQGRQRDAVGCSRVPSRGEPQSQAAKRTDPTETSPSSTEDLRGVRKRRWARNDVGMVSPLSVDDAFTVGVSFDLIGGYLLGRGLLASPLQIAARTTRPTTWDSSFNDAEAVAQIESRADALLGLLSVAVGFSLQAGGYLALIAGATIDTGLVRALGAAVLMVLAAVVAYLGVRANRATQVKRVAVSVARANPTTARMEADPDALTLYNLGRQLGYPFIDVTPEGVVDYAAYARRYFDVDRVGQRLPMGFPSPSR